MEAWKREKRTEKTKNIVKQQRRKVEKFFITSFEDEFVDVEKEKKHKT